MIFRRIIVIIFIILAAFITLDGGGSFLRDDGKPFVRVAMREALAQLDWPPFNAARPRTYYLCENNACKKYFGKGFSECRTDADCKTSHTTCLGNACIVVPEPGEDECVLGRACDSTSHRTCVNYGVGPQCVAIPGPPRLDEVTCDDDQDCIDADIPPIQELPQVTRPLFNFCGSNGEPCECTVGELPIDPALIKGFNTTVHAEKIPAFSGQDTSWANRWHVCESGLCAVDLRVGLTAEAAYQRARSGVPVVTPFKGTVRKVYPLEGGYGSCVVIGSDALPPQEYVPPLPPGGTFTDLGRNSNSIPCPAGTKDLGVVTTRYTGSYAVDQPLIIRLCQIPDIPGEGNNTQGIEITGGAIINSRVAAAWQALGKKAKADGVALYSTSSFRLADSCGGTGTGDACAQPGQSPHQMGVAIDFGNNTYVKGSSTTSCSGRAIDKNSTAWKWLYQNADQFGFRQYTYESWHWDPLPASNRCGFGEPPVSGL